MLYQIKGGTSEQNNLINISAICPGNILYLSAKVFEQPADDNA